MKAFIIEFGNREIEQSCRLMKSNKNFTDLEQYIMAKKASCDLILSKDKGFVSEGVDLMSSGEVLENF